MRRRLMKLTEPYLLPEALLTKSLAQFKESISGRILDIGCGDFRFTKQFLSQKTEIYGIDNWLGANYHKNIPERVTFYYADARKLPFKNNSFNNIICTEVIEHVKNPKEILREARRVLRNDGKILLSVPFLLFIHGAPHDYHRYTIYGLEHLLNESGLVIEQYLRLGEGILSILNSIATYLGFLSKKEKGVRKIIYTLTTAALNKTGEEVLKRKKLRLYTPAENILDNRTNPAGYVLIATKKKPSGKESRKRDPSACPNCKGAIDFATRKLHCKNCKKNFTYYQGIPVLGDRLHEKHENS